MPTNYTVPRELMERALANAERSRDFEELYLYDLREQIATHRERLDGLRSDVARMKAWLSEEDAAASATTRKHADD